MNEQNQFLEFLKESKVRCFSKTKEIPGIFHLKSGKKSGNFRKKGHNVTCGNPFLQKFPEFLDFLQLRVSTTQKGIEDVLAAVYL